MIERFRYYIDEGLVKIIQPSFGFLTSFLLELRRELEKELDTK